MPLPRQITRRQALYSCFGGVTASLALPLTHAAEPAALPRFVAVGYGLRRLVSDDGMTWRDDQCEADEARHKEKDYLLRGVAAGKGLIVAVGGSKTSRILVSPDGKVWKDHSVQNNFLGDVACGNDLFVAVGYQRALVSKNGTDWAAPVPLRDASWRRIEFGGGRFVAVGLPSSKDPESGCVTTSTDGAKWSSLIVPDKKVPHDVAYGNGRFVIVGGGGLRESSKDGVTWEHRTLGEKDELLSSVIWTGKQFLASGNRGTYSSADGVKWEKVDVKLPSRSCFGEDRFVGCGTGRFTYSADGKTWKPAKAHGTLQITKVIHIPRS